MDHVVTCFVRNRGAVLLTRRSDETGTYSGRWAGVSGYVEGDPADAEDDARRELREETGLTESALERLDAGETVEVDDEEGSFVVHPFLFESETRSITPNEELAATEWTDPTEIRERRTVPRLWETWRRVAPTVDTVRGDRTHGSAWISARALEALRDAAAEADDWEAIAETGRELRDARPSMAAVGNRVNRVLSTADRTPESVVAAAIRELRAAFDADDGAAATAARRLRDAEATSVATLSRSGTVRAVLRELDPERVLVAESRPEREGVAVAEWAAAETGAAVTLTTEAALPAAVAAAATDGESDGVDAVVVGADAVLPDGRVVNKTGTAVLAAAARSAGVPVYVVAARDKVRPAGEGVTNGESENDAGEPASSKRVAETASREESPREAVYDGDADVAVFAPTFERVPAEAVDGVATEDGLLDAAGVRAAAAEHADHADWE